MLARSAALALLLGAVMAPAATAAPVTPLAALGQDDDGAVLADGAIVYGQRTGSALRVLSRPQAGGAPTELLRTTGRLFDLSAETGGGAVLASYRGDTPQVFAGPVTGPLAAVAAPDLTGLDGIAGVRASAAGRLVAETPAGEDTPSRLRLYATDGTSRLLPLPAGFDVGGFEVTGGLIASLTVKHDRLLVADAATGALVRDLPTGSTDPRNTIDFALGADGTVALLRADDDGLTLLRAGPADANLVPVLPDVAPGPIAVDGTRIAMTASTFRPVRSRRVIVIDVADPTRVLSRGPVGTDVDDLAIAGDVVAYALPGCAIAGPATGGDAPVTVPAGPCVRTQVSGYSAVVRTRKGRTEVRQRIRCLAGPGRRCRIRVSATIAPVALSERPAERVGSDRLTIRQGRTATVRIRVRGRATIRTLRREAFRLRTTGRITDPGGRSRTDPIG